MQQKRTRRRFAHTFGIASKLRTHATVLPALLLNTKVFSESSESSVKKISYNYTQQQEVLSMCLVAVKTFTTCDIMNCNAVYTVNREQSFLRLYQQAHVIPTDTE